MKIHPEIFIAICQKYDIGEFNIEIDLSDKQNQEFFPDAHDRLLLNNDTFIDFSLRRLDHPVALKYNDRLYRLLHQDYPALFPTPEAVHAAELRSILNTYTIANSLSTMGNSVFKKRTMLFGQDIIGNDKNRRYIGHMNDVLDEEHLNTIITQFGEKYMVRYYNNERGCLVVYDTDGYKNNQELVRLQFMVRKLFNDIHYHSLVVTNTAVAIKKYFKPEYIFYPKVIVLCGDTESNNNIARQVKCFDPFATIVMLTQQHITAGFDAIFDEIIVQLSNDYSDLVKIYFDLDAPKEFLMPEKVDAIRQQIIRLGKEFVLNDMFKIWEILIDLEKKYNVKQLYTYLDEVLKGHGITREKVFNSLVSVQ